MCERVHTYTMFETNEHLYGRGLVDQKSTEDKK